jgi:flagellar protein FliO/FliZ
LGGEKLKKILFVNQSPVLAAVFRLVLAGLLCLFPCSFPEAQEAGSSAAGEAPAEAAPLSPEAALILGEESPALPISPQGTVSFFTIFRTIAVLLLAAAAIYGLVYFLKRISRPRDLRDPNLRVLASLPLGQNRFIHAVILGSRVWLVGSSEGGLSLIADVEEQEAIDALLLEESRRNSGTGRGGFPDFRAMLRRFSPSPGESPGNGFTGSSVADNIRKRQDRLRGL